VNDFVKGVGYFHEEITAFYLPPEFYALNLTEAIDPWTPVDTLALLRLINFHLSYNWSQDLLRDIFANLENGELKDLVEEIVPFSKEFSHNLTTVLDDEDMK
jgi:acyl-homoserine lactone acylase PvdQ